MSVREHLQFSALPPAVFASHCVNVDVSCHEADLGTVPGKPYSFAIYLLVFLEAIAIGCLSGDIGY